MPAPQPLGWRNCEHCGTAFQRRWGQSVVSFNKIRFCSMGCNNRSRMTHRPLTMAALSVLSILASLEDEAGTPPLSRQVADRYFKLRSMPTPLQKNGQPNTTNVISILRTLSVRGLVRHRNGKVGTREGAYTTTPIGRAELAARAGAAVVRIGKGGKLPADG